MAEYLYLPIPVGDLVTFANDIANNLVHLGRHAEILRNPHVAGRMKGITRWRTGGCLRAVAANDTLYLLLHGTGTVGMPTVGQNRPGLGWKSYTPERIAEVLEAEGLSKDFRNLHILACGAGLSDAPWLREKVPHELGVLGASQNQVAEFMNKLEVDPERRLSFARRVHDAMRAQGYAAIRVTGYLGDVKTEGDVAQQHGFSVKTPSPSRDHLDPNSDEYAFLGKYAKKQSKLVDPTWSVTYGE